MVARLESKSAKNGNVLAVASKAAAALAILSFARAALDQVRRCGNLNFYSLAIIDKQADNVTRICKWGDSLGLRLPQEIAAAAGLVSGALVRVRLRDDGALLVTPIAKPGTVVAPDATVKPVKIAARW